MERGREEEIKWDEGRKKEGGERESWKNGTLTSTEHCTSISGYTQGGLAKIPGGQTKPA